MCVRSVIGSATHRKSPIAHRNAKGGEDTGETTTPRTQGAQKAKAKAKKLGQENPKSARIRPVAHALKLQTSGPQCGSEYRGGLESRVGWGTTVASLAMALQLLTITRLEISRGFGGKRVWEPKPAKGTGRGAVCAVHGDGFRAGAHQLCSHCFFLSQVAGFERNFH
ncbi:hypothetical protein BKA56DRAFT_621446 [Ilyonectria sp. MPI-CAGE-AT-0026]|nr:hypothetical protein BKA56DRAFT_621446 [Ilyonectria sp. MPI-CAGE-AT-0026]